MLHLYQEVREKEGARKRSEVKKTMRNIIVRSGFDKDILNQRLIDAGWAGFDPKEIEFFFG